MAYLLILGLGVWVFILQDQVSYLSEQVKKLKQMSSSSPIEATPAKQTLPPWKKAQQERAKQQTQANAQINRQTSAKKSPTADFTVVKLFSWIGGFILLLAIAFWIKYSLDNNLISPSLRIGLSVILGITLWTVGAMIEKKTLQTTAYTLCASGISICFIAWFSSYHFYHLISQTTSFVMLTLAALAAFGTAVWKKARYIGYLAQIMAFLTPCLFPTEHPELFFLLCYVTLTNLVVIASARICKWNEQIYASVLFTLLYLLMACNAMHTVTESHIVLCFAFLFSLLYAGVSFFFSPSKLFPVSTGAIALVFWCAYTQITTETVPLFIGWAGVWGACYLAAVLLVSKFKEDLFAWGSVALSGVTAGMLIYLAGRTHLHLHDGLIPLLIAALYFVALAIVHNWQGEERIQQIRLSVLSGLVTLFITLSFVECFSKEWLTIALAAEGSILIGLQHKYNVKLLPKLGLTLLSIVGVRLLFNPCLFDYYENVPRFFNWFLYTYGLCAAATFAGAVYWKEKLIYKNYLYILGGVLAFALVNLEIASFFANGGKISLNVCSDLASAAAYTVAWALCGAGCLFAAIRNENKILRYAGIGLVGLALSKLFLSDLWQLSILPRIIVLIGVAVILIGVSFAYQQFKKNV